VPAVTAISHDIKAPLPPEYTLSTFPWLLFLAEVPAPPAPHSFTLILVTPFGMVNEDEPLAVYDIDVAKDRMDNRNSNHADLDHERTREYFSNS